MRLQDLSKEELKDLLNYLKTYELQYKNKINLPENITFGIEIEGVGKWFDNFSNEISDEGWLINSEISLSEIGDEVSSPIFNNNHLAWSKIKYMCELLDSKGIYITDRCAGHIHYGQKNLIDEEPEKLLNILKIWAAFESVIYKYSAGNTGHYRKTIWEYAKPSAKHIKNVLENIGDYQLPYPTILVYFLKARHYGINIENLHNAYYAKTLPIVIKNTIEVRVPNGTLNPAVWQNNIKFFGNLFTTAINGEFDKERIKYIIQKLPFDEYNVESKNDFSFYQDINLPLALELADTIFTDENDKYGFLAQYLHTDNIIAKEKTKTLVHY